MTGSGRVRRRDIERTCSRNDFIAKLRRLADAMERGQRFVIRVAGERVVVPCNATVGVEHERGDGVEEVEFQMRWKTIRRARRLASP